MGMPGSENDAPIVNGFSHISLIVGDGDCYYDSIAFYLALGFEEVVSFDRSKLDQRQNPDVCMDSEKEAWLHLFNSTDADDFSEATVKIRLVPEVKQLQQQQKPRRPTFEPDTDWRGTGISLALCVPSFSHIISYLKSESIAYQLYPTQAEPVELYTHDPNGNLIGFTTKHHPFATVGTSNVVRISKAAAASKQQQQQGSTPRSGRTSGYQTPQIQNLSIDTTNGKRRKIGVLTSGGDSPGMNAAVRAVVRMTIAKNCDAFAIYEGYDGLVQGGDMIKRMSWEDVRGWLSEGGTLIGTARCATFRERSGRLRAAKNLVLNGIDALIICGGDGSLTGADIFRSEWPSLIEELVRKNELTQEQSATYRHLFIAGLVGSIDNDMASTDSTIGAYSSLHRICEAVDSIGSTALSHSRAFIVEVMGRHCGWLALMAGLSTGADFSFIPERPPEEDDWESAMCEVLLNQRKLGKRKTIIIVAEGALDRDLKPITPDHLKDILTNRLKLDTRVTTLGHTQRGGVPCAFDRTLATLQGARAVEAVLRSTPDTPSPMIGISENKLTEIPLVDAVKLTHSIAKAISEKDFRKAMDLRDPEFEEYYQTYTATTIKNKVDAYLPLDKRLRIAIIHVGAPAGGMNAATRAAVRYCVNQGHTPIAIHNGIPGLVRHDAARELGWMDVEGWTMRGGSEIGTNRTLPESDIGLTAWMFQRHRIDALLLVGGFEAYTAICQFRRARSAYPAFRIPMVCLPATISNNVPGTEYSLGTDTCLNSVIEYCDSIKQSASATRRRVFVVEVQVLIFFVLYLVVLIV